jgi:hypothetical protein
LKTIDGLERYQGISYSKDTVYRFLDRLCGKHHCPQIFPGLLVASEGNPIGYGIFEGNIFESHTFIPVLRNMASRFSPGKPIVIADAGLLSNDNVAALERNGYRYIPGARPICVSVRFTIASKTVLRGISVSVSLPVPYCLKQNVC